MEDFWVNQGATLLINWLESSQEDVREMAAKVIVKFVINIGDIGDDEKTKYEKRANAVIHGGGIRSLLNLAKSSNEGDQIGVRLEVAKTITILCLDNTISNVIVEEGGIQLLLNWVNSTNKTLFEETIKALKNLSLRDAHNKIIIFECGGLEVLMNLVYRWTSSSKKVLKHVLVTLENMASDDKISMEIIKNGGLNALVTLTQEECMSMGVLNQIIRVFANLAGIGYTNNNNITFELEPSLLQRLEQLIRSPLHDFRY
ncbi:protein ARABIDILLO 1-like [Impatiens glandulifera]|uniref:protein ARABIDILLO 1-like n=1 Tax=Impatiens glandulifera TaxID=253017 RepID=UPI001FB07018|nr:protein ARABIDILLO 1-like [Impatiens glandulifera]